jgi:hypothetical protein
MSRSRSQIADRANTRRPARHTRRTGLRRLHRWLGVAAVAFVVVLSVTGIALNHSTDLDLDSRFLEDDWLLSWYGIAMPPVSTAVDTGAGFVSLVGDRLFVNQTETLRGIDGLKGAVHVNGDLIALTDSEVLFFSSSGDLIDRMPAEDGITGIGRAGATVTLLQSDGAISAFDPVTLDPVAAQDLLPVWSGRAELPGALRASIERAYRGTGVSLERLLLDVHSGRIFARAGTYGLDIVGVLLVVLATTGLLIWIKPKRKRK